jgi:hypothetical protein
MQTQTLDFSDLGARPVAQPGQANGQLDFSDLGGKRVSTSSAGAAPESSHWYTGVGDTLGSEGQSLWDTIKGTPGAIYHAFADPTTPEEMQESHGLDVFPGATGISRLTAQPVTRAIDYYRNYAKSSPDQRILQQSDMLNVAPEAMGAGAASVIAGKVAEVTPRAIGSMVDRVPGPKAILRGAGKFSSAVGNSLDPDVVGLVSPRAAHGLRLAGKVGRVASKLGREASPPVYPGAPLPESPGTFPGAPLPETPPTEVLQARELATGGQPTPPSPAAALGRIPLREQMQAGPGKPLPDAFQEPYTPPSGTVGAPFTADQSLLDQVRGRPSLTQQMSESAPPPEGMAADEPSLKVQVTNDYPRLIEQVKTFPELTRPVTENPVVGDFVRAMQKSGMPIAKRPNLLLKGSGRVNRILGPEEDLTDILAKSARWAGKQREQ